MLIIGQPQRGAVDATLGGLESQLGREVNVTYLTSQRWADTSDPFVATVRSRPLVALNLGQARAGTTAS